MIYVTLVWFGLLTVLCRLHTHKVNRVTVQRIRITQVCFTVESSQAERKQSLRLRLHWDWDWGWNLLV